MKGAYVLLDRRRRATYNRRMTDDDGLDPKTQERLSKMLAQLAVARGDEGFDYDEAAAVYDELVEMATSSGMLLLWEQGLLEVCDVVDGELRWRAVEPDPADNPDVSETMNLAGFREVGRALAMMFLAGRELMLALDDPMLQGRFQAMLDNAQPVLEMALGGPVPPPRRYGR